MSDDDDLNVPVGPFRVSAVNRNRLTVNYQAVSSKASSSAIEAARSDNWSLESENDGLRIESQDDHKTELKRIRGKVVIHASAKKVFALLSDFNRIQEWDENVSVTNLISRVSETHNITIVQVEYKGGFLVDPRDFTLLRSCQEINGSCVVSACSVLHPNSKQRNGVVRGTAHEMSYVITPQGDSCEVTAVFLLDMQTSLLSSFLVPTDFPKVLLNIRKMLE
eukprot:c20457_g1_i1.p1 GENE.c20457_g1_i1~~c20457_g1_i1.p1  ORF type:complete len:222 (+),score=38.59 c20457_g1_i1:44-709(+)